MFYRSNHPRLKSKLFKFKLANMFSLYEIIKYIAQGFWKKNVKFREFLSERSRMRPNLVTGQ